MRSAAEYIDAETTR